MLLNHETLQCQAVQENNHSQNASRSGKWKRGGLHFHKASTGGVQKGKRGGRGGEGKRGRVTDKEKWFFFR